jgi:hypothetical protein
MESHAHDQAWAALHQVARNALASPGLPAEVRQPLAAVEQNAARLEAWQQLRRLVGAAWRSPSDGKTVRTHLEELGNSANKESVARLRLYLACRARLEGDAELSKQVHPEKSPPTDGPGLLRDLKQAGRAFPNRDPAAPKKEPILQPLIPEGSQMSFRPAVKESLRADLPLLEELANAEQQTRRQILTDVERAARLDWHSVNMNLYRLLYASRARRERNSVANVAVAPPEDSRLVEVARLAGRPLDAAEKVMAERLLAKRSADEVANILRRLDRAAGGPKGGKP